MKILSILVMSYIVMGSYREKLSRNKSNRQGRLFFFLNLHLIIFEEGTEGNIIFFLKQKR